MSEHVLEINGSELRCFLGDALVADSAGYAIVDKREVVAGHAARALSRANPRRTHNRFWERLDQAPLSDAARHARHNADLAYAQLSTLLAAAGSPAAVIIAANGAYSQEQLGLLLGLMEAAGTGVAGLVDVAVAAGAACLAPGHWQHVELEAHRVVVTSLEVGDMVARGRVETIEDVGAVRLLDTAAKIIGEAFIRQNRFDPFHQAGTEQALYDALPGWLRACGEAADAVFTLDTGGRRHELRLPVEQLAEPLHRLLAPVAAVLDGSAGVALGERIAMLPSPAALFGEHAVLDAGAPGAGASRHSAQIGGGEGLRYITRLPASSEPTVQVVHRAGTAGEGVTHLAGDRRGYALNGRALYITAQGAVGRRADLPWVCRVYPHAGEFHVDVEPGAPVMLNGRTLDSGARLRPGDRLRAGNGEELRAIEVAEGDGA